MEAEITVIWLKNYVSEEASARHLAKESRRLKQRGSQNSEALAPI
jgi:hypothetical protein